MKTYSPDILTSLKPKTKCWFCGKTINDNARHWLVEMADGTDSALHLKCYSAWKETKR